MKLINDLFNKEITFEKLIDVLKELDLLLYD